MRPVGCERGEKARELIHIEGNDFVGYHQCLGDSRGGGILLHRRFISITSIEINRNLSTDLRLCPN